MSKLVQRPIQVQLQGLDNVFHMMIIALERLEAFLMIRRSGGGVSQLPTTAVKTDRDLHDDKKNPPTLSGVMKEVLLQCSALFFQTEFDDEELFTKSMKFFFVDLLEWYGGRGSDIPYDEVDRYILPICVALSRQVDSVAGIMQVCEMYVANMSRIEDLDDERKEKSVREGIESLIRGMEAVNHKKEMLLESGEEVKLTTHKRGSAVEGFNRLMKAMISFYDTSTPAKKVRNMFTSYVEGLPEFSDDEIEKEISSKLKDDTNSRSTSSTQDNSNKN